MKLMKSAKKSFFFVSFLTSLYMLAGCTHAITSGGCFTNCGGSGGGPFTIGRTVTGLTGTGLILQDNGIDNLTITGNTTFTFTTKIAKGQPYNVAVSTPPS